MRSFITLVFLENHAPSTEARKNIDFWLGRESMVEIHYVPVSDAYSMRDAKRMYKFSDLPCLIEKDTRGNKSVKYYNSGIDDAIKRLRQKYEGVKK
jgi:hypothetical protein